MSEGNLTIRMETAGGVEVVALSGEVDMRASPALRSELLGVVERRPARTILDLSGTSYIDSSGVGTLVEFKRKIERVGGRVVLTGMQHRVRSVFEITKLDRFFAIAESVEEARRL